MVEFIEKDLVKPRTAIRADLIAVKRFPCLHVSFLHEVVGFYFAAGQTLGCAIKVVDVLHCFGFENFWCDLGHIIAPNKV